MEQTNSSSKWLWIILAIVIVAAAAVFGYVYLSGKQNVKTTTDQTPIVTQSALPEKDLTATDADIQGLDNDLKQLDKIDASDDEAPSL